MGAVLPNFRHLMQVKSQKGVVGPVEEQVGWNIEPPAFYARSTTESYSSEDERQECSKVDFITRVHRETTVRFPGCLTYERREYAHLFIFGCDRF